VSGRETSQLWINQYGCVMKPHAVANRIRKATCALLAHSCAETAERHYNRASIAEAGRRQSATLAAM
jgi:hypothetical protein